MVRRLWALSEWETVPGCFPGLLGAESARVVQKIKHCVDLYDYMSEQVGPWYAKAQRRSPMVQTKVVQVTRVLRSCDWAVSADLAKLVEEDWSGITQTKLIEDGVRCQRVAEVSKSFNKVVSDERTWTSLMASDERDGTKHRFSPLPHAGQIIPRALAPLTAGGAFARAKAKVPDTWSKVVSTKAQASWYSPSPLMSLASCEDMAVVSACKAAGQPELASKCWLSILATPYRVIVSKGDFTEAYLVGKTFAGSAVLALPVTRVHVNQHTVFVLEPVRGIHWISILGVESWKAQGFSWVSPLQLRLLTGKWLEGRLCVMLAKGPAESLVKHCAREGFYDMPKSALSAIAKEVGCDMKAGAHLPEMLLALCSFLLPSLTDEDKLGILRKRMPAMGDLEQLLLDNEEAQELLEEKDLQSLSKRAEERKSTVMEFKVLAASLAEKVASKGSKSRGAASSSSRPSKRARVYPSQVRFSKELTVSELNGFLPVGCSFGVDRLDQSWRLNCYGQRFSRAWTCWGEVESAKQLIVLAWNRAIELSYESSCPFTNIDL
eukprot:2072775-Amphidinium_carterae.2